MSRRLTIVTQWYPPEQAPFGRMMQELAQELAKRGWQVTVITSFPNHPSGVLHEGYARKWSQEETVNGVKLCRVWTWLSPSRSVLGRLATFLSFSLLGAWRVLRQTRPDVIFAVLQPLSVGVMLPGIARLKGASLVFNLQDLHPDAQIRSGLIKNKLLIRFLQAVEASAYSHCNALTVICDQFRTHALGRGAKADLVFVAENWVDTDRIRYSQAGRESFRASLGLQGGEFLVLYAGTLGYASGAMVILEAAECLRDEPVCRFLIVGEGPMAATLKARAESQRLTNVTFLPFQPEAQLSNLQSAADLSVVTLASSFSEISVPSKLLAYLAAGRAVIASVPETSKTAELVHAASAGVIVPPEDGSALAAAIRVLAADPLQVQHFGAAARKFAEERLSLSVGAARYEIIFEQLCKAR
jgi:colanic acid biosynthesis glycosyl transferase WcaI